MSTPVTDYYTIARVRFQALRGSIFECSLKKLLPLPKPEAEIHEFKAGGNPLNIRMAHGGGGTEKAVIPSEAVMEVINEDKAFHVLEFLADSNRSHMLEVKKDNVVIWEGFMVPDQWLEGFVSLPYRTQFLFVDGLALLKDEMFAGSDKKYIRGRWRLEKVIAFCLSRIRSGGRYVVDEINIFDEQTTTLAKGTIHEKFKDVEAFRGMSCYDVLQECLKSYTARIEYHDNKYYLRRIDNTKNTVRGVHYQLTSVEPYFIEDTISVATREQVTAVTEGHPATGDRLCWQDGSQTLERLPGWKSFTYIQDYGRKDSIIPRSDFTNEENWTEDGQLKDWDMFKAGKWEYDDRIGVRMRGWVQDIPYIKITTEDRYSPENIEDNEDVFEFELQGRNISYISVRDQKGIYYGARGVEGEYQHERVREIRRGIWWASIVSQPDVPLFTTIYGTIAPSISMPLLDGDGVIFVNSEAMPEGDNTDYKLQAGVTYTVKVIWVGPTQVYFSLMFGDIEIKPSEGDADALSAGYPSAGHSWPSLLEFTCAPVKAGFRGIMPSMDMTFGMDGVFRNNIESLLEIPSRVLPEQTIFKLGMMSVADNITDLAPLMVEIKMIREGVILHGNIDAEKFVTSTHIPAYTYGRGLNAEFYYYGFKMWIQDTPVELEEEVELNPDNNQTGSVNIMFAETPIKNNFTNNKLKFFNNFFSHSLTDAPGRQWINEDKIFKLTLTIVGRGIVVVNGVSYSESAEIDVGNRGVLRTLKQLQQDFYKSLYTDPRLMISGVLNSHQDTPMNKILEEKHTKRRYQPVHVDWDCFNDTYRGTWHQVTDIIPGVAREGSFSSAFSSAFDVYLAGGQVEDVSVLLKAVPDAMSNFVAWSGDVTGTADQQLVEVTGDIAVTATFEDDVSLKTLTIQVTGAGGVQVDGGEIYQSGTVILEYTGTTEVTLEAIKLWNDVEFIGWGGDLSGTNLTEQILMDGNKTVNAEFEIKTQWLTVAVQTGGSVDVDGTIVEGGEAVVQGFEYVRGENARIEAISDDEYNFVEWDGTHGINTNKVRRLPIGDYDYFETAKFEKEPFEKIRHVNTQSCRSLTLGACGGGQLVVNDGDYHNFILDMAWDDIGSLITIDSTGEQFIICGINTILDVASREILRAYAFDWVAVVFLEIYPKGESEARKYSVDTATEIIEFLAALDSGDIQMWGSYPSDFNPADLDNTRDSRSGLGSRTLELTDDNAVGMNGVLNLNKGDRIRVRMFFSLEAGKDISIMVRRTSTDGIMGIEQ